MGYLGIYSGLPSLENSFGELGEDKLVIKRVYDAGVYPGPVPVINKKLSPRIDTYLLIDSVFGSIYSLHC